MEKKKTEDESPLKANRRHFFSQLSVGIGSLALGSLLIPDLFKGGQGSIASQPIGIPHFAPKAKRVIYLFQSGAPSQLESFDYKPTLKKRMGEDLPESIRNGQRLTGMTSGQDKFPLMPSFAGFKQYGDSGAWISDFFPYTAKIADDICIVKSMHTEAINHDPAITFFQTGTQQSGRPSMGSWMSYGLGNENKNLPSFVVLTSRGKGNSQGLYSKLWSSGFLDSKHQGVLMQSGKDAVLYLADPDGISRSDKRHLLDHVSSLNKIHHVETGDDEIESRIAQYEMAFRMQMSVPDVMDIKKEPKHIIDLYGESSQVPGTYAANCLQARRLAENGVRFIQLYHQGWDQHGNLPNEMASQAKDVDQASAALVLDLKQRGMLEDTLVIWGGEFGRTNYCQGNFDPNNYGRDHHPRAFSIWMAGGGIKPGITHGETDEFGYNIIKDPVHVNDFHATIMQAMGLNHEQLTFKYQGRRFRLTDVAGNVVKDILT
ncbi:MAG: sulfatase [Flavobacteriaceae bacterium]|nr:MAG: sulfatase [Flavobacteriaceae bacterium]